TVAVQVVLELDNPRFIDTTVTQKHIEGGHGLPSLSRVVIVWPVQARPREWRFWEGSLIAYRGLHMAYIVMNYRYTCMCNRRERSSPSPNRRRGRHRPGLFYRDGLSEIARLVDVTTALDSAVVGEELERDNGRDGLQKIEVLRGINDVVSDLGDLLIALGGDGNHLPTATPDLLHIGDDLVVHRVLGGQTDRREALINHGDKAVLHLAGSATLSVDVGNLFELQGAFQGHGIVVLTANEEKIVVVRVRGSYGPNGIGLLEHHLDLLGQALEAGDDFHAIGHRQVFETPEEQGNHHHNTALTRKDFGGGHTDL